MPKVKNSGDYADGGILEVTYTTTLDLSYTVTPSSIFTDKMIKYVEEDLGIDFDYYNVEQTESYSVLVSTEATKAPMEDLGTDPLAYYEVTANPVVYEYVFTTVLGDVEFRLSYDELTVGFCSEYMLINTP